MQMRGFLAFTVLIYSFSNSLSFAEGESFHPSTQGFYPIWESTAYVESHRDAYVGTNGADFGIGNVVQVGVQPVNFIYRTPNVFAKIRLFDKEDWQFSTQVGAYYLLDQASRAFFSAMYSSRLDNPDYNVMMFPASMIASRDISDWLEIHQTLTALTLHSPTGPLKTQVTFGYSIVAELKAKARHSVLLHAGEIGFWNHDFALLGTSYRYHNTWMEFRLGYFYRMRPGALQSSPLLGFGFYL
jgi:hypothetical protein